MEGNKSNEVPINHAFSHLCVNHLGTTLIISPIQKDDAAILNLIISIIFIFLLFLYFYYFYIFIIFIFLLFLYFYYFYIFIIFIFLLFLYFYYFYIFYFKNSLFILDLFWAFSSIEERLETHNSRLLLIESYIFF